MHSQKQLLGPLSEIVGDGNVLGVDGVSAYTVEGKVPQAAAFPASVEEVSALMAFASTEGLRVTPWGGGTKMNLGTVPDGVDLVLGLSRLNALVTHEPADMTATFQAGIALSKAQELLAHSGQFIGLDPPYSEKATIGGILATNSSGPRRLRYGSARDILIAVRIVEADGTIFKGGAKVVKSVSGYDMNKLFIGSLGTLGIIVETTFRLHPVPKVEKTFLISFASVAGAVETVARILDSSLVPSAVELLCPVSSSRVISRGGLSWPEGHYALALAIGSVSPEAVDAQLEVVRRISKQGSGLERITLEGEVHLSFWLGTRDFSMSDPPRAVLKASLPLTKVGEAVSMGESIATRLGLELAVVSEAASGIVRYYFAQPAEGPQNFQQGVCQAVDELRTFALESEGSLVVLEAPSEVRGMIDIWGPVGSALSLMQGLKQQFDPQRVLNPGRFVGGI